MIARLAAFFGVDSGLELAWIGIGLSGQLLFSARFILQWIASERARRSVIPVAFWYFSLAGGITLLAYAIYRRDPVFMLGQSLGLVIYLRNISLIRRTARQVSDLTATQSVASSPGLMPLKVGAAAGMLIVAISFAFSLFAIFPHLDLKTTAWFYQIDEGFPANHDVWLNYARVVVWSGSQAMFAIALTAIVTSVLLRRAVANIRLRVWTFILCLYALGPGVMVELIIKPLWGRARPTSTTPFGGDQPFSLPIEFVDHCSWNCSFVSGEVSGATALMISLLVLLAHFSSTLSPIVFKTIVVVTLLFPFIVALQRISTGRHFLSDTVLAMMFTLLLALGLAVALRLFPKKCT